MKQLLYWITSNLLVKQMLNGLTASRLLLPFILYFFSFLGLDASPAPLLPGSSISICLAIFPIYIAYIAFVWNHYSSCLAFFSHKPTLPRPTTNYLAMQGRPSLLAFQVRSIYTQQFRNRAWSKDFNERLFIYSGIFFDCDKMHQVMYPNGLGNRWKNCKAKAIVTL